ncbi:hypothetical protein F5Y19DRAFT_481113 [Xylariaceae sp. FL1651]|nr:hypothetical protein F5Y19DRAFT_481113 [Xylariaceae sp. FL1651]
MLSGWLSFIIAVLPRGIQSHNPWPLQLNQVQVRDVLTTEYVTTLTTCAWSPAVTTVLPMTTVYAIIAEGLNPAAAVAQTVTLDDVVVLVIATGVQNTITPSVGNAPPTTVVVTQMQTSSLPPALAPTTILTTQISVVVSVSQQFTTEKEHVTEHVTDVQTEVQTQIQTVTVRGRECATDADCQDSKKRCGDAGN